MTPPPDRPPSAADAPEHGPADRIAPRLDAWLAALGLAGTFRRDCALAVLVAAVSAGLVALALAEPGLAGELGLTVSQVGVVLVLLTAQSLLLSIRRTAPVLCLVLVVALQLVLLVTLPVGGGVTGPATTVAAYTVGTRLPVRRVMWSVAAAVAAESAGFLVAVLVAGPPVGTAIVLVFGQLLSAVLVYGVAALVGVHVATRRRYVELVRTRAAEAVAAQRARSDAVIGRERARLARELHDVAAHHLSGMVVQAAVVERLVDPDPEAAKRTAAWVRTQGRRTLRDLRLVVGALREPGVGGDRPDDEMPVPGLAVLDGLVETARELGTPVVLECRGEPREVAPIADATCYRVVQEALANAREHAPGAPVRLTVTHDDERVAVEVANAAPERPAARADDDTRGFGLAGMAERAQLVGGTFEAGPTTSGGWRVHLSVRHGSEEPE